MAIFVVFDNLVSLFILILAGFVSGKNKLINTSVTNDLCSILIKITLPAAIFSSMIRPFNTTLLFNSRLVLLFTFLAHMSFIGLGFIITKVFNVQKEDKGIWIYVCTFANNGFMGLPILFALFGEDGLLYGSFSNIMFNFLAYSIGVKIINIGYSSGNNLKLRDILVNGPNIAMLFGSFFYIFQLPLPSSVFGSIQSLGSITTPLSMFTIGLILSKNNFREMVNDYKTYILCFLRLLVMPLFTFSVMRVLPIDDIITNVLVVVSAMPAASAVTILSEQYNTNTSLAAKSTFVSNLLCIFTIPLILLILQRF